VSFTASATDPDGDTLTYAWNFGDGATGSGATVSHAYAKGGNYIAVVSVNDGHNHTVQGLANAVFLLVNHPETRAPATPPPAGSTNPVAVISANQSIIRAGDAVSFIRVGTLDEPDRLPPDIHIYTASKQPWVVLPPGVPAVEEYYDRNAYWPEAALARRRALLG